MLPAGAGWSSSFQPVIRRCVRRVLRAGALFGVLLGLWKWLTARKAPDRSEVAVHGISTSPRQAPVPAPGAVAPPVIEPVPDVVAPAGDTPLLVVPVEAVDTPPLETVPEITAPAALVDGAADAGPSVETAALPAEARPQEAAEDNAEPKAKGASSKGARRSSSSPAPDSGGDGVDVEDPGSGA